MIRLLALNQVDIDATDLALIELTLLSMTLLSMILAMLGRVNRKARPRVIV